MEKCISEVKTLLGCQTDEANEVISYLGSSRGMLHKMKYAPNKFNMSPVVVAHIFGIMKSNGVA